MIAFATVKANLESRGFKVSEFQTEQEAAASLNRARDVKGGGVGGAMTLKGVGVYGPLATHNETPWHCVNGPKERDAATNAQVYLSSVNGLAQTGELINIDGTGNRVAATLYGHEKIYLIVGENKLADTYEEALWRARNVAAPKNAQRLSTKTPCAVQGDRCYDCKSPDRICRGLTVLWGPMMGMETEVVLIHQPLGY